MAIDIYELAKQRMAQTSQDTTPQLIMQGLQMVESWKDKAKVTRDNNLASLVQMIPLAGSEDNFNMIDKEIDTLLSNSGNDELYNTQLRLVKDVVKRNADNYTTFKTGVNDALDFFNNENLPNEYREWINTGDDPSLDSYIKGFGDEYIGEDGGVKRIQFLTDQERKINGMLDKIGMGYDGKTKRYSLGGKETEAYRNIIEYKKQLDIAAKTLAGDGVITEAEAKHIIDGNMEWYMLNRKEAKAEAEYAIKAGATNHRAFTKLLSKAKGKKIEDKDDLDLLTTLNLVDEGTTLSDVKGYDDDDWSTVEQDIIDRMAINDITTGDAKQKFKDWVGRDFYKTMDKDIIVHDYDWQEDYPDLYDKMVEFEDTIVKGKRGYRHNSPLAPIFTDELAKEFGATKGEPFYNYWDADGKFQQKFDIKDIPSASFKDKELTQQGYTTHHTAKFKNVDQGENAAKWLMDKVLKQADGDLKSFIQTWSGLPEGSEELNNYYNHIKEEPASKEIVQGKDRVRYTPYNYDIDEYADILDKELFLNNAGEPSALFDGMPNSIKEWAAANPNHTEKELHARINDYIKKKKAEFKDKPKGPMGTPDWMIDEWEQIQLIPEGWSVGKGAPTKEVLPSSVDIPSYDRKTQNLKEDNPEKFSKLQDVIQTSGGDPTGEDLDNAFGQYSDPLDEDDDIKIIEDMKKVHHDKTTQVESGGGNSIVESVKPEAIQQVGEFSDLDKEGEYTNKHFKRLLNKPLQYNANYKTIGEMYTNSDDVPNFHDVLYNLDGTEKIPLTLEGKAAKDAITNLMAVQRDVFKDTRGTKIANFMMNRDVLADMSGVEVGDLMGTIGNPSRYDLARSDDATHFATGFIGGTGTGYTENDGYIFGFHPNHNKSNADVLGIPKNMRRAPWLSTQFGKYNIEFKDMDAVWNEYHKFGNPFFADSDYQGKNKHELRYKIGDDPRDALEWDYNFDNLTSEESKIGVTVGARFKKMEGYDDTARQNPYSLSHIAGNSNYMTGYNNYKKKDQQWAKLHDELAAEWNFLGNQASVKHKSIAPIINKMKKREGALLSRYNSALKKYGRTFNETVYNFNNHINETPLFDYRAGPASGMPAWAGTYDKTPYAAISYNPADYLGWGRKLLGHVPGISETKNPTGFDTDYTVLGYPYNLEGGLPPNLQFSGFEDKYTIKHGGDLTSGPTEYKEWEFDSKGFFPNTYKKNIPSQYGGNVYDEDKWYDKSLWNWLAVSNDAMQHYINVYNRNEKRGIGREKQ